MHTPSSAAVGRTVESLVRRRTAAEERSTPPQNSDMQVLGSLHEGRTRAWSLPLSAYVETFSDVPTSTMFAVENAAVANVVTERKREFATVRYCARQALRQIGVSAVPILPDADGVPQWPSGVVGSMTHCAGYRAAVVARCRDLRGVGIDAEPHAPVPGPVRDFMLRDEEWALLAVLSEARPDVHWDRIFFCAKEAAYKTLFPLTRCWLDFTDLSVELSASGTFEARVLAREPGFADPELGRLAGKWLVRHGLVVATTCVRRGAVEGIRRCDPGEDCNADLFGFGGQG